ncbi:MAG: SEC-C metal-binding domain-containing protein [Deltaproteobacteria bacterium]|nr:SEC-C metal-binding domain-containing protein [Deltaproteobacteria bacterium]
MEKISRNEPCPCGSGRKYKKCCLLKEDELTSRHREEGTAVSRALDWLAQHYPQQVSEALDTEFFGALEETERDRLSKLSPSLQEMVHINSHEWLINDACIEVKGKRTPVRELLLGSGGLLLVPAGREWIKDMGERPLSLYEVQQVTPGVGIELADLLRPETAPVWISERSASRSLVRLDIFGTRLIRRDSGFVMSGAAYPFARVEGLACRDEILREMKGVSWNSDLAREVVSCHITDQWLEGLIAKRPLPTLVDTSTGEPIMLTTDHYRVRDWQELGALLARQPDVEGDRKEGWVRFNPLEGEIRRSRAALNPKGNDTLEVFCRTLKLAEDTRQWLENLAGKVLSYQIREMVDPRSEKALESAPASPQAEIPPEIASQLIHNYLSKFYANWTEEIIPALGNKTPRQAIKTEKGRQAVIDLLKSYEHGEARRVKNQGGEPFDFGFLWERLEIIK